MQESLFGKMSSIKKMIFFIGKQQVSPQIWDKQIPRIPDQIGHAYGHEAVIYSCFLSDICSHRKKKDVFIAAR